MRALISLIYIGTKHLGIRRVGKTHPSLSMGVDTRRDYEFVHIVEALALSIENV